MNVGGITDNQAKEIMGKVYYKINDTGQRIILMQRDIPWVKVAAERHADRWEYLHWAMRALCTDLEYLYTCDGDAFDGEAMQGLMKVGECLSLRTVIQHAVDPTVATRQLGINSPQ